MEEIPAPQKSGVCRIKCDELYIHKKRGELGVPPHDRSR